MSRFPAVRATGMIRRVQTVGLSISHSFEVAGILTVAGTGMALAGNARVRWVGAFLREAAVIGALYALWQLAGEVSITGTQDAFRRSAWIAHTEAYLPLPSEATVQHWFLGFNPLVHVANLYYATMHFTCLLLFLIWLFVRHRAHYRPVRQVMAWTTLGCLVLQLWPTAPPRLTPGIVDTGRVYHESVYDNGLPFDHLSAMPSVHVAWAVLVGYYVWRCSTSRWRFVGPVHATLTVFFVVLTGNHWWLDAIVAVAILALCAWGVYGVRTAWQAARRSVGRVLAERRPRELSDAPLAVGAGAREHVSLET